ncbi:hypothetical protein DSCA_30180 [Desulfosarcina alkanivorans]|uniref:Uncharacterized protein n=2 Tax=Desulfosarcina alkanivorans TaxID=571177 RepID=A0A5K7YJP3_9BACT|nr:hypothetical protein DSCA_30180 [Desulfosarcina alkanivorans]
MIDQGIDPRDEKLKRLAELVAKQTETIRQEVTVSDAWAVYIEDRKKKMECPSFKGSPGSCPKGGPRCQTG